MAARHYITTSTTSTTPSGSITGPITSTPDPTTTTSPTTTPGSTPSSSPSPRPDGGPVANTQVSFDDEGGQLPAIIVMTDAQGDYTLRWSFPFDTTGFLNFPVSSALAAQGLGAIGAAQPGNGFVLPLIANPPHPQANDKYPASPNSTRVDSQIDAYCLPTATLESQYAQSESAAAAAGASSWSDAKAALASQASGGWSRASGPGSDRRGDHAGTPAPTLSDPAPSIHRKDSCEMTALHQTTRGALCRDRAAEAANGFVTALVTIDCRAWREGRTIPTAGEVEVIQQPFWEDLIPALAEVEGSLPDAELALARSEVRAVLNPWLLRSHFWARSFLKPHGYAGDFRMLEWMYDLEHDDCTDVTQPAVVNILDGLYRSVHSVQAVWHRRRWFADLIAAPLAMGAAPIRVLDVACGGSRYLRDAIGTCPAGRVGATFVDQDPAALSFVDTWLAESINHTFARICAPVRKLPGLLPVAGDLDARGFDVVLSTGLFDYLPQPAARELLSHMAALIRPGGSVAICNFAPDDQSRAVKDWISDWPLIYRTQDELEALFPPELTPEISRSPDGGLIYARAIRTCPEGGAQ